MIDWCSSRASSVASWRPGTISLRMMLTNSVSTIHEQRHQHSDLTRVMKPGVTVCKGMRD